MTKKLFGIVLMAIAGLSGCASVSSSSAPALTKSEWTQGPVFLTTDAVPASIDYEFAGDVKANARAGYDSVESLYPLLVKEARKIGANAVIDVRGGRSPSLFSWAAPFTYGKAIKVEDPKALETLDGRYYQ